MSEVKSSRADGGNSTRNTDQSSTRQDDVGQAHFLRLPDELIAAISRFYNPPIPFELGHFTLPSRYMREGRDELRSMAATCRRLARVVRPLLYRTLVFVDDKRRTRTVHFYSAKDIHTYVRELYWQPSYLYNDMSPVFLPIAENLTYLVLAFLPQNVPDEFISDDYAGLTTLRTSFTNALRHLKHLEALEIPFWESREDPTFTFSTDIMPSLKHVSIGDWQQWDAFEVEHKIDVVKWLIHPDLDFDENIIRGFFEHLGRQTRVLQFAAQSGWGRTDLPQGLTENLRQISWYKDIRQHPLDSFTLHGFNPLTSHKREWARLLPSFLSLLTASNVRNMAFIDVPSLRNARRHRFNWSGTEPMLKVTTVQIALALDEDTKDHGDGGEDFEEDDDASESHAKQGEAQPMSERVTADDLEPLLALFPNVVNLSLANIHRATQPTPSTDDDEHDGQHPLPLDSDAYEAFARDTFLPAARAFVDQLRLFERFTELGQVVFRSAEARLAVRFRREEAGPAGEGQGERPRWHEELRRLY
ncbi:hypothetical protein JCM3775_000718 [Rhodotorula graminis]|uniref:Uncharacterized protein n=1 Tax=Rhodotorula graminis (strain WP1) TaxID=578459 RepID=A0A0P9GK28_RHOGW|nr:uncharacterized protein RHOBADRAFT_54760 [Rhodotorula graminis WP1]KPV73550.1 hypothetical protein RHOBADRAFT_54760 [Rhodotorula graminis WP1]